MEGKLQDWMDACDPLMQQALQALRSYHEAMAQGRPDAEVEKKRLVAEGLFQQVNDLMLKAFGSGTTTVH